MARTGSCHNESGLRQAESVSYGEWQELVLAIILVNWVVRGGGKNQFLPFSQCLQTGLKYAVMGSGKNRFLPFPSGKNRFLPLESGKNRFLPFSSGKTWFLPLANSKKWFLPI